MMAVGHQKEQRAQQMQGIDPRPTAKEERAPAQLPRPHTLSVSFGEHKTAQHKKQGHATYAAHLKAGRQVREKNQKDKNKAQGLERGDGFLHSMDGENQNDAAPQNYGFSTAYRLATLSFSLKMRQKGEYIIGDKKNRRVRHNLFVYTPSTAARSTSASVPFHVRAFLFTMRRVSVLPLVSHSFPFH